jgi:UPF0755 protein
MANDSRNWEDDERFAVDGFTTGRRDFSVMPRSPNEALEPDHPPEAPHARRVKRKRQRPVVMIMNTLFTATFIGIIAVAGAFYYAKLQFDSPGPLSHSTVITIPRGDGVNAIAARLEREGIISDRRIFMASVLYFNAQSKLKAGDYAIKTNASMRSVLDTLVEGKAILYSVTIPEGWTSQRVVERLLAHEELSGEIAEIPPEGSLLPDTYRFARGTDRMDIIARMQEAQKRFMERVWPGREENLPISTHDEALILASIVEKETGKADERGMVAAVFLNRLRLGMRLGSDPTIIYGLVGGQGTLGRPIYRSEITKPTPYNTYVITGLPPTPIANPGRAAIEAVLRPDKTDYLYFVADGTGGHAFARTLAEHNRNVAEWRKIEQAMRAREAAAAAAAQARGEDAQQVPSSAAMVAMADGDAADDAQAAQPGAVPSPSSSATTAMPLPLRRPGPR